MIQVVSADIATLDVDAIVNAANEQLMQGGGICGAIYRASGPSLIEATDAIGGCDTGDAVMTAGFDLPARFVIHAVGPVWRGGSHGEGDLLRRAYSRSFQIAMEETSMRSIAFPAISTGIYGFPKEEAAAIAVTVMRKNDAKFDRIIACLFDLVSIALYERLLGES